MPRWISRLTDPVLKADFQSFYAAGRITEAEMAKALADLAAENGASDANLSAGQFADLQLIASNIGEMGASHYLKFITDAFVYGDAANRKWTGGAPKSVALGDLAVGYTPEQLSELTDKWFYGTDLPKDKVLEAGYPTVTITYSAVDRRLFGPDGPKMSDVNQGYLGDCYLLASLAEVARQDPSAITSMITNNHNGTFGVRFYVDGVARYVTVNRELADHGTEFNTGKYVWASIVETAFAEIQEQGLITGNAGSATPYSYGNSFSTTGNGGYSDYALEAITDATEITNFDSDSATSSWTAYVDDHALEEMSRHAGLSTASVLSTLAADLLVGDDLDLNSATNAKFKNGKLTLIDDHVMSIYGYDASTGKLRIRNPWGRSPGQTWATTFQVKLSTLLSDGDSITVDNNGKATLVRGASVLAASALQDMAQVASFSVRDSVANIDAGLAELTSYSKLTLVAAVGTAGADTLNLAGLDARAIIRMDGNSDDASLSGHALSLGSGYDSVTLGLGDAMIHYSFNGGGVESISDFTAGHDFLSILTDGASIKQTFVNGGDWISSSADLSHGVFLADVTRPQAVTVSNGIATVF